MRRKLGLILFVLVHSVLQGQNQNNDADTSIPDIVPPSPMAYEMTRFEAQQPSMYTGTANVTIPLYGIDFDGWQIPLTLSYYASGIKPNQEASEVGLGWSLNATAVISRTVSSGDDLLQTSINEGFVYDNVDYVDFFDGSTTNWDNLSATEKASFHHIFEYGNNDTEPDIFNYNFFGFNGSFSLSKKSTTGDIVKVIKMNKDGVVVEFNEGAKNFTLTTPTGFVGQFTVTEKSTNLSGAWQNGDEPTLAGLKVYSEFTAGGYIDLLSIKNSGNFRTTTAWYLEKITSPRGKEIVFTYNKSGDQDSQYVSISSPSFGEMIPTLNETTPFRNYNFSRVVQEHVYQTGINIPNEVNVSFIMEDREDIQSNDLFKSVDAFPVSTASKLRRYKQIQITGLNTGSTLNKVIDIEQSYFNADFLTNTNIDEYQKYQMLRSRLDNVIMDDQEYNFQYSLGVNGLSYKSTQGIDHHGYYNGKDDNEYLAALRHGYYSNRHVIGCNLVDTDPSKKYYYYVDTRLPDLNYGIAGSLSKVIYPTGGSTTYTYQNHEFYSGDRVITNNTGRKLDFAVNANGDAGVTKTGGLRIEKIETKDTNGTIASTKTYDYLLPQSTQSSGLLMTPMMHISNHADFSDNYCGYFINYAKSMSGQNTAKGAPVGYSRVVENTVGLSDFYTKEYTFENVPTEVGPLKSILYPKNYKNGKVLFENATKSTGGNVSTTMNEYTEVLHDSIKGLGVVVKKYGSITAFGFYPYVTPALNYNNTKVIQKTHFISGSVENEMNYAYDEYGQVITDESENSRQQQVRMELKRVNDYVHTSPFAIASDGSGEQMHLALINRNLISQVLEKITYVGNEVVAATGYKYDVEHGNVILRAVYSYDKSGGSFNESSNGFEFGQNYRLVITYDDYDDEGNILQYTVNDGVPNSFIWGYNKEFPIVKGVNITYNDLLTAHNATIPVGSNYEANIRTNTPNAFISTYEYDPLTGVTKMTDPRNVSTHYTYDQFRRLKEVKDLNWNLLQVNEYNFAKFNGSGSNTNMGGLTVGVSVEFGVVTPGNTSETKYLNITNDGNYDISITDITLPTYFNSSFISSLTFQPLVLKPGDVFNLPITFTSPTPAVGVVTGQVNITSNDINGNSVANLNATSEEETRILRIDTTSYIINTEFGNATMRFFNDGNSPIWVWNVVSDDPCITNEWENIMYDPNGLVIPYIIPPNHYVDVRAQLGCPLNSNDNWDGNASLNMIYFDPTDGLLNSPTITISRFP